jgi:hypothetical protein
LLRLRGRAGRGLVLVAIAAVAAFVAPIGDPNRGVASSETTLTTTTNTIPPTTATVPPPSCPTLQFVGVRGSGEDESDGEGYGNTILAMRNALAQVPGLRAHYINYAAIYVGFALQEYGAAYVYSVSEGTYALEAFLVGFMRDCPRTYVILGGYSQGAHVVGEVVDHHLSSDQLRHIAAVAMFGDPMFNPKQPVVDIGGYNKKLSGIATPLYGARVVDKGMVDRVKSYCLYGDPVCNFSLFNAGTCAPLMPACAHYRYVTSGYTRIAADTAIKRWRQLQKQNPL